MYTDRTDAGRTLAAALASLMPDDPLILALPRGGVPVAAEIAAALKAPLKLLFVRKLGLPHSPEVAMGSVVDGANPTVFRNEPILLMSRTDRRSFEEVLARELKEIERRKAYFPLRFHAGSLKGRTVILVDDGAATGSTMEVAVRAVRDAGAAFVVVALPVAPPTVLHDLRDVADRVVCPLSPPDFNAVGSFYDAFPQLDDRDVLEALQRADDATRR